MIFQPTNNHLYCKWQVVYGRKKTYTFSYASYEYLAHWNKWNCILWLWCLYYLTFFNISLSLAGNYSRSLGQIFSFRLLKAYLVLFLKSTESAKMNTRMFAARFLMTQVILLSWISFVSCPQLKTKKWLNLAGLNKRRNAMQGRFLLCKSRDDWKCLWAFGPHWLSQRMQWCPQIACIVVS